MPLKGKQSVVPDHAAAVVGDLNELFATGFHLNPDACRAGIN